jgi:hypothetical protein
VSRTALVALVACYSAPALGQEPPPEAVRVRYEAPSECPAADAFMARVRQRTSRGREVAAEEMARTFTIEIRADAPGFIGSVEFLDDAGAAVSRRVHGEECDAVVSSLALITALALDATLRADAPPDTEGAPTPTKSAPTKSAPPKSPAAPAMPAPRSPVTPAAAPSRSKPWLESARVGLGAAYDASLSAPTFGLLGQLDFSGEWALRLLLHYEDSTLDVDSGRQIGVRLLGLETSVCPARLRLEPFALHACAAFDLGSLRARGIRSEALVSVSSETRVWAAVGPELRLAWEPHEAYWAELRGELQLPLVQRKFELQNPRKTAYDIPSLTAQTGISLGVRFW